MEPVEINDVYFRRFFVPVVVTVLIFAAVACIITNVPGVKPQWETYGSVFGAQLGGALKSLRKK
jgi:hypothetical protein